jgi:hypothetical protein
MPTLKISRFSSLPIVSLLVSGMLVWEYHPVQAKILKDSLISTPVTLPYIHKIPINQQPLGQLQKLNFHPSPVRKYSQYNQNFERYFVYVDSSNPQILQRVRQVENSAYIRNYNGRDVIQSGVFNEQYNAQRRVRELELNGISGARIVNSENLEVTYNAASNAQNYTNNYKQERTNFYYVVIPGNGSNLSSFGRQIRQKVNINVNVFMRTQPLGNHIAVGPFSDRSQAEQWNSYLKNSGYDNARVYYGK